jgi:hypothetical protein
MRKSPSIIPAVDHDIYLVVEDDFGRKGRCWRETDVEDTDLDTVIADMLEGQFKNPVRVVGFNTAEGWSRDVSEDVAHELRQRCADQGRLLPESLEQFVDRHAGPHNPVQLPLPIRF